MSLEINGVRYPDSSWRVESNTLILQLPDEYTFEDAVEAFTLESGYAIKQYNDNDDQIAEYYVVRMGSIEMPDGYEHTKLVVKYYIGNIEQNAQAIIDGNLEEASDAILELAEYIVETAGDIDQRVEILEETQKEELKSVKEDWAGQKDRLDVIEETLNRHNNTISHLQGLIEQYMDRIARVENRMNGGN